MRGIWQLARQSLTLDSRKLGQHAIRFGLVAVLYLAVWHASREQWRSSIGLSLFNAQLLITVFFLSVTAIFGFSQAITEEKEEDRLGLIRLADISPLAIILGKMAGLICESALLIGLQFPFTIIAITLGGVSWPQVTAAYAALASFLWLLACVGMLASVIQPTGGTAARLTAILVSVYTLPPLIPAGYLTGNISLYVLYQPVSLPLRLREVTESDFTGSPWCAAVTVGLVGGLICLVVSWRLLDSLAMADRPPERRFVTAINRQISRRAWSRPMAWRDYLFLTGGYPWTVARIVAQVVICVVMLVYFKQRQLGFAFAWSAIGSGLLGILDGTWSASRLFRDEVRHRTWSALVQTPRSIAQVSLEKCVGWFLGLLPSIVAPFLFIGLMLIFHEHVTDLRSRLEVIMGTATIGTSVFGYLHLLVLLSLYFGWKATPMTLTICFGAAWLYVVTVFRYGFDFEARIVVFGITLVLICGVMVVLQQLILQRLERLAETA